MATPAPYLQYDSKGRAESRMRAGPILHDVLKSTSVYTGRIFELRPAVAAAQAPSSMLARWSLSDKTRTAHMRSRDKQHGNFAELFSRRTLSGPLSRGRVDSKTDGHLIVPRFRNEGVRSPVTQRDISPELIGDIMHGQTPSIPSNHRA